MHGSKDSIIVKSKDINSRPKQLWPAGALILVAKLCAPSVVKAGEAAVLSGSRSDPAAATLATAKTSPLNSSTPTATTAVATTPTATTTATPTPTAAATSATEALTPATTPTAATTSATSTAYTTTTLAAAATTLATLALAAAALPTKSRSSPNILSTKDVNSSSRSVGRGQGGGGVGHPSKKGVP
ncbi:unnamed protein product [Closterium sp. NIES-53]